MNVLSLLRCSRPVAVIGLALALFSDSPAAATTIDVSPTNLAWNSNAWVDIVVSGFNVGSTVDVVLVVDPASNGTFEASNDYEFAVFRIQDGVTNSLGATVIPDDDDATANSIIVTKIPYFGVDSMLHTVGSFFWIARVVGGTPATSTPFRILPPVGTSWITGQIKDYYTSNGIPGALLEGDLSTDLHYCPRVMTATDGTFRLDLPLDVATNELVALTALRPRYLQDLSGALSNILSGYLFTNDLHTGANPLPRPLYLIPCYSTLVHKISGRVVDDATNPVAAALLGSMDADQSRMGIAITDTNGYFETPAVHSTIVAGVGFESSWLNVKGLIPGGTSIGLVTSDVTNVSITCPRAKLLARASVVDDQAGTPVPGVEVVFESDMLELASYTLSNGCYEISLVTGTYSRVTANDGIQPLGYAPPLSSNDVTIDVEAPYTNVPFRLRRGYLLAGYVYTANTNALPSYASTADYDCSVVACLSNTWDEIGGTWSFDRYGHYEMLVPTGTYRVVTSDFPDYLGMAYSNYYRWEWDNGALGDPVVVTTNGTNGINFYLPRAAFISGRVQSGSTNLENIRVSARIRQDENNWQGCGETTTESDGSYELGVPEGTNYSVFADDQSGSAFWLGEWYYDGEHGDGFTVIQAFTNLPATNIDFNLSKGGVVQGTVFEDDWFTVLRDTWVELLTTNRDYVAGDTTSDSGQYRIVAAPGVYLIQTDPPGWCDTYYSNFPASQWEQANTVTVQVECVVSNANIGMPVLSYIQGHVSSGGVTAVTGVEVSVEMIPNTNEFWNRIDLDDELTDTNGDYSLAVPPGSNYLVRARRRTAGSFYLPQTWSNVFEEDEATLLTVPLSATLSNIDFQLVCGMRIEGQVTDSNAAPLNDIWVDASRYDTNGWWTQGGSGNTDTNGTYGFPVPTGTNYFLWISHRDGTWYPSLFYSNTVNDTLAEKINAVTPGTTRSNIDFRLYPGYRVQGYVFQSDGVTPGVWGGVDASDAVGTDYGYEGTEGDGSYELYLSTNVPLYLRGGAQDSRMEYYNNRYSTTQAVAFQLPALTTTSGINFALYEWNEDHDTDGVYDNQEDARPDGIYNPSEDWASYTNSDTDGEGLDDFFEWNWAGLSPQKKDTDADGSTDYAEVQIAGTDPTNAQDYLSCTTLVCSATNVIVLWRSEPGKTNYWVKRTMALTNPPAWTYVAGPVNSEGDRTSITDTNPPSTNGFYRVYIPY